VLAPSRSNEFHGAHPYGAAPAAHPPVPTGEGVSPLSSRQQSHVQGRHQGMHSPTDRRRRGNAASDHDQRIVLHVLREKRPHGTEGGAVRFVPKTIVYILQKGRLFHEDADQFDETCRGGEQNTSLRHQSREIPL